MLVSSEARQLVLKYAPHVSDGDIVFHKLSGLTNLTFSVEICGRPVYVLKIFSDGFDRQTENRVVQRLSEHKLAARLIYADCRYRIQEFIHSARHPSLQSLNQDSLLQRILIHMYEFHQVNIQEAKNSRNPSDYLWSQEQILEFNDYQHNTHIENFNSLFNIVKQIVVSKQKWRSKLLPSDSKSIRFCHNDLNNLNILLGHSKTYFIDYDYVAYNYLAFDIANFLNEACINYQVQNYPGFVLQKRWSFEKISEISQFYPGYYAGLELQVLKFMCVVNLYWAIWSLRRYELNNCATFGIVEHGLMRMELFFHYNELVDKVNLEISQSKH